MLSDEMNHALHWSGHLVVECKCRRTHFSVSGRRKPDYEEGELERLLEQEKISPEEFISHGDDFVTATHLSGITLVEGCPCELLETFENTIWQNRGVIIDYLKRRIDANAKRVNKEKDIVDDL